MYHDPTPITAQADWANELQRGDVVLFRYPVAEETTGRRPPKDRPCLVLEIDAKGGHRRVTLAYGTDAESRANRGYDLVVRHQSAMATAGLSKPTRFVLLRRISVFVDHVGFQAAPATGSPILGRLDDVLTARMNALRARLQAEHDIAADRRRERDEDRRRWQREERAFLGRNRALRAAQTEKKGQAND